MPLMHIQVYKPNGGVFHGNIAVAPEQVKQQLADWIAIYGEDLGMVMISDKKNKVMTAIHEGPAVFTRA